jgi:predicted DCC family thiol-disulfide oxidoreductase YuxK
MDATMEIQINPTREHIIFFDGVCGLCNGFVDFVMATDKKKEFKFSPLQSEFAQKNLPPEMTANLDSVVYLHDGKTFRKSQAVIRILEDMGGIWSLAKLGKILPESLLNSAYDLVAQNRYKVFGKKETCRLPTPEERARFII